MSALGGIRFVPMSPELFGWLPVAPSFRDTDLDALSAEARAGLCAPPNFALAMLEGGRVIGAGGVVQMWPGRGLTWMLPGAWMERRHFGRALRRCAAELDRLERAGMWRIECTVLDGAPPLLTWARRLGFVRESRMAGYGTDAGDHLMMVRLSGRALR